MSAQQDESGSTQNQRRVRRTVLIFGLLAVVFYAGAFCLVYWRHVLS